MSSPRPAPSAASPTTPTISYDLADNLTEIVYPSDRIVIYERDSLGRVSAVKTKEHLLAPVVTIATNITYQPFGPIDDLDHGNGLLRDLAHDLDYRLTDLVTDDLSTDIQDLDYGHNAASSITSITDNLDVARDRSFTYDALQRLTSGDGLYGVIDYDYDAVGNRLSRTITNGSTVTETYSYALDSNHVAPLAGSVPMVGKHGFVGLTAAWQPVSAEPLYPAIESARPHLREGTRSA